MAATGCADSGSQSTTGSGITSPEPPLSQRVGFTVGALFELLNDQQLDAALADIESLHVGWLRIEMSWDEAQPDNQSRFDWAAFDRIIRAANRHNVQVLPILAYTPKWARLPECTSTFKCAPANPAQFAFFAGSAAAHFKNLGVHHWEIWNEPNIIYFWRPAPNAKAYTDLLRQSYSSIKRVDPQAVVISGGLSPVEYPSTTIDPIVFLQDMYKNGAKGYMDAVGYHPYSFPKLPSDLEKTNAWSLMSDLNPSIRSVMNENGDGDKQIWGTEFGVPTSGPLEFASEDLQAFSFADALKQMKDKPWLATLFFDMYQDKGNDESNNEDYFGVIRFDGSRKPAYYVLKEILAAN